MLDIQAVPVPPRKGKRIVIFADGTGNSFTSQESNIWRLYQALAKTEEPGRTQQLVRYIPGVGTSGNAVLRMIDGATGIGVPSNVRKLYRFLCWNWNPEDEIYLFGFSRGAFTVRTLAAMIARQGLMPREIDGRRVSGPEMSRNVKAAWLAYRTRTAPFVAKGTSIWNPRNWEMNPLISIVRVLRDCATNWKRRLMRQMTHREVFSALPPERRPGRVKIRFMGLFDTVEAYGMPVEEMCKVWNRLIWPIRFRNQRCSWVVQKVRHALSLDDERKSFHPIRFDVSRKPGAKPVPETQEVWFAGVHSDVGGGYPDDETSYEPLLWMADEAAWQELVFDNLILSNYRKRLYPQAQIHDSREGLASLYRYAPRFVDMKEKHGGPPVVHHSVLEKMRSGANGYAPVGLPETFSVYPSNGTRWAGLKAFGETRNEDLFKDIKQLVGRRTRTNWTSIGLILTLAVIPVADWLLCSKVVLVAPISWISAGIGAVLPGWAGAWVEGLMFRWWLSGPILAALWAIYSKNRTLGYQIKDRAMKLWSSPG